MTNQRIRLINPNSSLKSTTTMMTVATASLPANFTIEATTSSMAPALITNPDDLQLAEKELLRLFASGLDPLDGVVIAAFGDPGLKQLRETLDVPVVGLADAAMRQAASFGRYSVITTTPLLADAMYRSSKATNSYDQLVAIHSTTSSPVDLMENPVQLEIELARLIDDAIATDKIKTIIVGGGPLAQAAAHLTKRYEISLIQPVVAAIHQIVTTPTLRA